MPLVIYLLTLKLCNDQNDSLCITKKNIKRPLYILALLAMFCCVSIDNVSAQDGIFSQLYSAPLYFNPAFASLDNKIEAGVNYRSQLFNSSQSYSVTQFSFIYPIIIQKQKEETMDINHRGAVGLSLFRETAGTQSALQSNGGLLTLSYNLHLNKDKSSRVAIGAQGGYVIRNLEPSTLKWGSQYQDLVGFDKNAEPGVKPNSASGYPVVNAGAVFVKRTYKQKSDSTSVNRFFYVGASGSYLNAPDISFTDKKATQHILLRAQAGIDFKLNDNMLLSPHIMYQTQNGINQFYGGLYYYYMLNNQTDNPLTLIAGSWYRHQDSIVGMLGTQFKKFTLGVSYDYRLSSINLESINNDVLEISLKVRFGIKEKEFKKLPPKKQPVNNYKPMLIL